MKINSKSILSFLSLILALNCSLHSCIEQTFTSSCKSLLYQCLNDPACSYQFDINSRHIKVYQKSKQIPKLYYSNPLAITLYECMKTKCNLPEIDVNYPKTLPLQHCMFQVYDICGGKNMEQVYRDLLTNNYTQQVKCYQKYCL